MNTKPNAKAKRKRAKPTREDRVATLFALFRRYQKADAERTRLHAAMADQLVALGFRRDRLSPLAI